MRTATDIANTVTKRPRESDQSYGARCVKLAMQLNGLPIYQEVLDYVSSRLEQASGTAASELSDLSIEFASRKNKAERQVNDMI